MAQMTLAVLESTGGEYHYFSAHACVFAEGNRRAVFVGGTLVGSYDVSDKATRSNPSAKGVPSPCGQAIGSAPRGRDGGTRRARYTEAASQEVERG